MKTVTILGSTGSIGQNTINVISSLPQQFEVQALVAHSNTETLAKQAIELNAKLAVIADKDLYNDLKSRLSRHDTKVEAGAEAVIAAAKLPSDIVMSAIVGAAGLEPTMAAIERGAHIALANKECLVCAGDIMTNAAKKHKATILPVDSEHNAIFQVFDFNKPDNVEKIILTASGGPFRNMNLEEMKNATPELATAHPNWNMGKKISVDSATMMNKGLEVIEAYHLFPVMHDQIEVVVHPESVVHSLVEYVDGSVLAQLGTPDMRTPISLALAWPERINLSHTKLSLTQIGKLTFEPVEKEKFPAVELCYEAMKIGGNSPAVLSTANEVAVEAFLENEIGFLDIIDVINTTINNTGRQKLDSISDVIHTIENTREATRIIIEKIAA